MSSATSAILSMVARIESGTATLGTRRRAILATCTERSPIRSSSLTIRSAETTMRRSPATGCWSESSAKALSSTRSRLASMASSALMTCSAIGGVAGQQRLGGAVDRDLHLTAHGRRGR